MLIKDTEGFQNIPKHPDFANSASGTLRGPSGRQVLLIVVYSFVWFELTLTHSTCWFNSTIFEDTAVDSFVLQIYVKSLFC